MVDMDRLLGLRLVVARHGEMDRARWWNTRGMLGPRGAMALRRGLPRTHRFAQARVVFAVARSRCEELFDPAGCLTLWKLSAEVEDEFEAAWPRWLAEPDRWDQMFEQLAAPDDPGLMEALAQHQLVSAAEIDAAQALRRSAEGRAVKVSGTGSLDDRTVVLLAAGFAKGEPGAPAVPYAASGDA